MPRILLAALCLMALGTAPNGQDRSATPMVSGPHQVDVERDVKVRMRDTVTLATDLYLPSATTRAGLGTVLLRTPYDKHRYRPEASGRVASMLASRGFAVAVQDVRGKFDSDGLFTVSGHDAQDAYDTIGWLAARPWSNGKVAMFGCSYDGEAQILTAPLKHPALVALLPRGAGGAVGTLDGRYRFFGAWNGGAFELGQALKWFPVNGNQIYYRAPSTLPSAVMTETRRLFSPAPTPPLYDAAKVATHLPLVDMMQAAGAPHVGPLWREFIARPLDSKVSDEIGYLRDDHTVAAPALHVNSWFDYGVAETLATFNHFRSHATTPAAREHQHVIVSPAPHCGSEFVTGDYRVGELELGDPRLDLWALYVRWLSYWLYGEGDLNDVPRVQYYLMGRNVWRTADAWPVPGTQVERLYLHSAGHANSRFGDGRLGWDAPVRSAADDFVYDPAAPVPTRGGPADIAGVGPRDQRDIEARADVLVYTSAPLPRDLDVVGPLSVELFVSSSAVDTDITAKLVDVHLDGRALGVQEGILRLRYREGMHRQVRMRPGEVYPIRIDLQATAYTFARGHAIRLEISSSNFPRFDRNLNTGGRNVDEATWVVATNTVHHGRGRASHLLLPVLTPP